MSGPSAQELEDGFGFLRSGSGIESWHGVILRMPVHQVAGFDEEGFTFYEVHGRVFLVVDLGKRAAIYADWPQSIYLGDRFPPFATVVKNWPKELRKLPSPSLS
jgi:hypothetical protein